MAPRTRRFAVTPNSCDACADTLEQSIKLLDPNASFQIDLEKGEVVVVSEFATGLINGAILLAGFDVKHKPAGGENGRGEPG